MYMLSDDVMLHTEEDKQYLINATTGKVFLLNDMAALIVNALNEGKLIEEIKKNLSNKFYEIDSEQISGDVDIYISMLIENQSIIKRT